jgi:hypothetical protein
MAARRWWQRVPRYPDGSNVRYTFNSYLRP